MIENQTTDIDSEAKYLVESFEFALSEGFEIVRWADGPGITLVKQNFDQKGFASQVKIGFSQNGNSQHDPGRRSLYITVTYGRSENGAIVLGSGGDSLYLPIDLEFRDEFFFDPTTKDFFFLERKTSASEILDIIKEAHFRPTKLVAGLYVRAKLIFWRRFMPSLVRVSDAVLLFFLFVISGETIREDIWQRWFAKGEKLDFAQNSISKNIFNTSETIEFFGYKAKRWSVVFYALLHLILLFLHEVGFLQFSSGGVILNSSFFTLCYAILSFAIIESLIPAFLKILVMKVTPLAFMNVSFRSLRIL